MDAKDGGEIDCWVSIKWLNLLNDVFIVGFDVFFKVGVGEDDL